MIFKDLREFISCLEKEGQLARINVEVDPSWEVGPVVRKVFDQRGPALLFEKIKGRSIPLLVGAMDTFKRYALGVGAEPNLRTILHQTLQAARNPIAPKLVNDAPCQEVVYQGADIDLEAFPVPWWHHLDAGPYIGTLGLVITRDPKTGARNMGIYREQIQGRDMMGLLAQQHVALTLRNYLDQGRSMPVATVIGVDPSILAASCFRLPFGQDELAVAGALQGAPVPLVKCRTIDLEVPATSEIVLEGEIPADDAKWQQEGPFGEFTGYYGGVVAKKPTIYLKAITTRKNPIYQATLEGMPPSESNTLRTIGHTTGAWLKMEQSGVPGFKELYITDMGCANFMVVISLNKQYYLGNARQAILSFWSQEYVGKWTIVVDDDIDIFDRAQVEWALATRVQPHRDIMINYPDTGMALDPSIEPDKRDYPYTLASRIGVDATKEFKGFEFPPEIRCRPEDEALVEKRWKEYGIK